MLVLVYIETRCAIVHSFHNTMYSPRSFSGLALSSVERTAAAQANIGNDVISISFVLETLVIAALVYAKGMPLSLDTLCVGVLVVFCSLPVFAFAFVIRDIVMQDAQAVKCVEEVREGLGRVGSDVLFVLRMASPSYFDVSCHAAAEISGTQSCKYRMGVVRLQRRTEITNPDVEYKSKSRGTTDRNGLKSVHRSVRMQAWRAWVVFRRQGSP